MRFKGFLAEYGREDGYLRPTSVTREDMGDGACETVFVTDFEVLRVANPNWRRAFDFLLAVFVAASVLLLVAIAREIVGVARGGLLETAETLVQRGEAKAIAGRHREAVRLFDKAILVDPDMAEAYACRAVSLEALGQLDKSMADRHKLAQLRPVRNGEKDGVFLP